MKIKRLIEQLFHHDPTQYENAHHELLKMGPATIQGLAGHIHSPDAQHRERIIDILGRIEHLSATPLLLHFLQSDPLPSLRAKASRALFELEDLTSFDTLLNAIHDPAPDVRKALIYTLNDYAIPRAIPTLLHALKDKDAEVAYLAAWVLACRFQDPAIRDFLLDHAPPHSTDLHLKHIQIAAALRDKSALPFLLEDSHCHDADIRLASVEALGKIGDHRLINRLSDILHDDEALAVRIAAAHALGDLDNWEAIETLHWALNDPDQSLVAAAAKALGLIHSHHSLIPLLSVLERDILPQTRKQVVRALGRIGDEAATEALRLLFYEDIDYTVQYSAALALADLANPRALSILRDALDHPLYLLRQAAAKAFGQVRDPAALDALIQATQDADRGVRHLAALAILKINRSYIDKAFTLILEDLYHADYDICWYTLRSIQGDPHYRLVNPLLAVLDDPNSDTRALAAEVLGTLGDTRAISSLTTCLQDPIWEVRRAARLALLKLGYNFAF